MHVAELYKVVHGKIVLGAGDSGIKEDRRSDPRLSIDNDVGSLRGSHPRCRFVSHNDRPTLYAQHRIARPTLIIERDRPAIGAQSRSIRDFAIAKNQVAFETNSISTAVAYRP